MGAVTSTPVDRNPINRRPTQLAVAALTTRRLCTKDDKEMTS
jgi:hypothetical protein